VELRDYTIICRIHDSKPHEQYCLALPELRIFTTASSFKEAYDQLELDFKRQLDHSKRFSLDLPGPSSPLQNTFMANLRNELVSFFIKSTILVLILVSILGLFVPVYTAILRNEIRKFSGRGDQPMMEMAINIPRKFNQKWDELTPKEVQEIQAEWDKLFKTLSPFLSTFNRTTGSCENSR
jgi:hypothetical protein